MSAPNPCMRTTTTSQSLLAFSTTVQSSPGVEKLVRRCHRHRHHHYPSHPPPQNYQFSISTPNLLVPAIFLRLSCTFPGGDGAEAEGGAVPKSASESRMALMKSALAQSKHVSDAHAFD